MSFLRLQGVTFGYAGQAPVVQNLDLDLAPGEIHCLVGRSGCGKTTLLKLAAGLLQPLAGAVTLAGAALTDRRAVGFVFQQPTLLDWLNVRDNVQKIEAVIGMQAVRFLNAGQILQYSDLRKETVLKKGQIVRAMFGAVDFEIAISAEAQESGSIGDVVKIKNLDSQKVFAAKVVERGIVRIE